MFAFVSCGIIFIFGSPPTKCVVREADIKRRDKLLHLTNTVDGILVPAPDTCFWRNTLLKDERDV